MSNDIKNALEHCIDNNCVDCPNNEELGSGEFVCNARLLPKVLAHITNLEAKLAEKETEIKSLTSEISSLEQDLTHYKGEVFNLKDQLAKSERLIERLQQIVDKLRDKKFAGEKLVNAVNVVYEPLYQTKCDEVEELKKQLHFEEQGHDLSIQYFEEETNKLRKQIKSESDARKRFVEEVKNLKQQLEEKDKEIKQLKLDLGMFKSVNEFINGYGIEKAREILLQTEKTKHQDKISFAVEQIVKTKETLIKFLQDEGFYENEWYDLFDKIDLQIKELKGE